MNFGEIVTSIRLSLGDAGAEISRFEIGQAIDEAQLFIASVMPSRLVPEIVRTRYMNPDGNQYESTLPPDFIEILAVSFATSRGAGNVPNYKPARLITESEWQQKRGRTRQHVAYVGEHKLHMSPMPTAGIDGAAPPVEATYKSTPRRYIDFSLGNKGALVVMTQPDANLRLIAFPEGEDWTDYGLSDEDISGGILRAEVGLNVWTLRIAMTSSDGTYSYIVTSEHQPIPNFAPGGATEFYALIEAERSHSNNSYLEAAPDGEMPELAPHWHPAIVSYASGRILSNKGSPLAERRMNESLTMMKNMGANIDYIAEARMEDRNESS